MIKKIVHIIPRIDYFGGIENFLLNFVSVLDKSKYPIILITFYTNNNKKLITELSKSSIEIYELKKALFERVNSKYIRFFLKNTLFSHFNKYRSLKLFLSKINPDLIFTHGEDSEIIASFLNNSYKIVNVIHGEDFFPFNPIFRFYLENISRKKFYNTVIVSNKLRNKVPTNYDYSIINAGIDLKKFEFQSSHSEFFQRKIIRFGFIGRLDKQKGIYKIVDAFIRLNKFYSNVILDIAGTGKEEKKIKSKIPSDLLSRVNFRGNIEDITSFYKNIDVLIICSESEGGPLVLLEAMATGVLVITNEVGIVPEIIKNSLNGRIIMNNSSDDIFRVM